MKSKEMQQRHVHTTIPEKYFIFAQKNNLKWNQLLMQAIEEEMNKDPVILKEKLCDINEEKERILRELKKAEQKTSEKKKKITELHKGAMPV